MTGYNDDAAATAKAIDAENWLHTGDLGRIDSRGYVSITGRVKEMIIRGGENLFPAEIENAMLEHEDIAEVAVVGVPCPTFGEQAACFMRARQASSRAARVEGVHSRTLVATEDASPLDLGGRVALNWLRQDPKVQARRAVRSGRGDVRGGALSPLLDTQADTQGGGGSLCEGRPSAPVAFLRCRAHSLPGK